MADNNEAASAAPQTPTPAASNAKTPPSSMSAPTGKPVVSSKAIQLNVPIKRGDTSLTEVIMRRPKVRDRLAPDDDPSLRTDLAKECRMIGNLCGLTPDEVEEMDAADLQQCQDTLRGFIYPQLSS